MCTQCGKCVFVCPHSVIRSKAFAPDSRRQRAGHLQARAGAQQGIRRRAHRLPGVARGLHRLRHVRGRLPHPRQVQPRPQGREHGADRAAAGGGALQLGLLPGAARYGRERVKHTTIPGSMLLDPLFEFSSACAGCGETPYIRLATQLFGDRMLIANATGCSSIYGGNLPATPVHDQCEGRGPAWSNSLFEDNAEFGLGLRLAADQLVACAHIAGAAWPTASAAILPSALLAADQTSEAGIRAQRERVASLLEQRCRRSIALARALLGRRRIPDPPLGLDRRRRRLGLRHRLRRTGPRAVPHPMTSISSCSTPRSTPTPAVRLPRRRRSAPWPSSPPPASRHARRIWRASPWTTRHVYVAQVAYGAKDVHTLRVFHEAESYPGSFADHRLQPLHRPRRRPLAQPAAAGAGGEGRTLDLAPPRSARAAAGKNPLRLDSPAAYRFRSVNSPPRKRASPCCSAATRKRRALAARRGGARRACAMRNTGAGERRRRCLRPPPGGSAATPKRRER